MISNALKKATSSDEHFVRRGMAEECLRTGRRSVRARLKHDNEIAGLCFGHFHAVGEEIERSAKRPHNGRDFAPLATDVVTHHDRIILTNDLTEIPGCGEVMVHAAVNDQVNVTPRDLTVDHSAHVDTGFTHEIPTELEHDLSAGPHTLDTLKHIPQVLGDRCKVERLVPGKIGDAKPTTDIDDLGGAGRCRSESQHELHR